MIIKKILNSGNYGTKKEDRTRISTQTSFVGLLLNLLLSVIKVFLFVFTGSVSILADAINNITDSISSVVAIIGVKISDRPADRKHPYGHGRIEYIATLIVASFVLVAGFEFIRVSYDRIKNPVDINYSYISIGLMLFSVIVKFYMAELYKSISKRIDSSPLMAQYKDSMGDVFITGVVIISIIVYNITGLRVDGYVGMLVSIFIIYSGYELIRDTLSDLIGEAPEENFVEQIEEIMLSYENVLGIHDIVITNYGPVKTFVTLDAEIPYDMTLVEAHNLIDDAEREIKEKLKCEITIHIDPVGSYSKIEREIIKSLNELIKRDNRILSFHDLAKEEDIIRVEIVVDGNIITSAKDIGKIKEIISNNLVSYEGLKYEIQIDRDFLTEAKWKF